MIIRRELKNQFPSLKNPSRRLSRMTIADSYFIGRGGFVFYQFMFPLWSKNLRPLEDWGLEVEIK